MSCAILLNIILTILPCYILPIFLYFSWDLDLLYICKSVILLLFFYCLFLYCFILLLCNLAQEFPSGSIKLYLILIMCNTNNSLSSVYFPAAVSWPRLPGDPGRVGPDAGRVQESIRRQAQRGSSPADRPDRARRPQRRPHGSDVCLLPWYVYVDETQRANWSLVSLCDELITEWMDGCMPSPHTDQRSPRWESRPSRCIARGCRRRTSPGPSSWSRWEWLLQLNRWHLSGTACVCVRMVL